MATSQNEWPVLEAGSNKLVTWVIPTKHGDVRIRLRNGSAGFILAHFILWFAEVVEVVVGKVLDDWGYAYRPVRGQTEGFSNHASGTAIDLNATKHVLSKRGTFSRAQQARILARMTWFGGSIVWGGTWRTRADEMHFELAKPLAKVEKQARRLMKTPRGKRILAANPAQRAVILS